MFKHRRVLIVLFSIALLTIPPHKASTQGTAQPKFQIPDLNITIPGLHFTEPTTADCPSDLQGEYVGCYFLPWIGEYTGAIYRFAVSAASILAAVVLMVAGFLWLTAGGNVNQTGLARSYASGAVLGLLLVLGSYTILYLVNPSLVQFKALRIPFLKRIPLEEFIQELREQGGTIGKCSAMRLSGATTLVGGQGIQDSFNSAGEEFSQNPIFLAAIAQRESSFRSDSQSPVGAYGIMQIMPGTASEIWNTTPSISRPTECAGANDPARGSYTDTCKRWMANNPSEVIRMGAAYFAVIDKHLTGCEFGGNQTLMAAGYNSGPYRPVLCGGQVPDISETLNYVRHINSNISDLCTRSGGTLVE